MDIILSYAMQEKTKRIISFIQQKKVLEHEYLILKNRFLFSLLLCIVFGFICFKKYYSHITTFTNSHNFRIIDFVLISVFILICLTSYILYLSIEKINNEKKNITEKYEKLRLNIIRNIDHNFCRCGITCDCKEKYIKEMKTKYGVDLIFS